MRLFVSIDFPEDIIDSIITVQNQLGLHKLFEGKLIKPEQLHLTLKFLGDVQEEQLPLIKDALGTISCSPYEVCVGSLGVLPSEKHIRIIWLAMLSDELQKLAQCVHEVLAPYAPADKRDFLNHVTLARVKKVFNHQELCAHLKEISIKKHCFSISHFSLKQSELFPEGPAYTDIAVYDCKTT